MSDARSVEGYRAQFVPSAWTRLESVHRALSVSDWIAFLTRRHTCGWRVEFDGDTLWFRQSAYSTEPPAFRARVTTHHEQQMVSDVEAADLLMTTNASTLTGAHAAAQFSVLLEHFATEPTDEQRDGCSAKHSCAVTRTWK